MQEHGNTLLFHFDSFLKLGAEYIHLTTGTLVMAVLDNHNGNPSQPQWQSYTTIMAILVNHNGNPRQT
jgi:hypothetical protein